MPHSVRPSRPIRHIPVTSPASQSPVGAVCAFGRAVLVRYARRAWAVGATAALVACSDGTTAPVTAAAARVASVEYVGTRAALFIERETGVRSRITFTSATDPIAGNTPLLPPFADANLLALGPVAWSPDGEQLAMVATLAHDQSEIVVVRKDGSEPRVASVNTQIILGGLDWSPDGTRLAYGMSTLPSARGVDLFVTDLVNSRVQRLTQGGSYLPLGGTVRFSADGRSILYAKKLREGGGPLFETYSQVRRVDIATGGDVAVSGEIVGEVQGIARSGSWAAVIRRTATLPGGDYDRTLLRVPLAGGAEGVLVAGGKLHYARLSADDARLLLVRDESTTGSPLIAYLSLATSGGTPSAVRGTGATTVVADAWFAR